MVRVLLACWGAAVNCFCFCREFSGCGGREVGSIGGIFRLVGTVR